MKRLFIFIWTLALSVLPLSATHNRAGEITLTQISDLTYEISITTFTYSLSLADRDRLEVSWGDNTYSYANRVVRLGLPNYYQKNIYTTQHTFPGPGIYEIVVQDPNRNDGVKNIPNSVNVIFSIKTTIMINSGLGDNSTPILMNPPIDRAAYGQIFIHNPAAYDPDGDSLSYKLTTCTEKDGVPIQGYSLPPSTDTIFINPYTGDLTWIVPSDTGWFNIAIDIEEWRDGVKIGNIVRDMQIEVYNTDNNPPVQTDPGNYCVQAGRILEVDVIATDVDPDSIQQWATGGPFILDESPASYVVDKEALDISYSRATFYWETTSSHVREQYYTVVFKAEDSNPETPLVDIRNMNIRVLGPPPEQPVLIPGSNSVTVAWPSDSSTQVVGYEIYRHTVAQGYVADSCIGGVPASTGYVLAGSTDERSDTLFVDDNKGIGLEQGYEYCYMIVSIYPDGAQSFPSPEVCTPLVEGTPSILEVSVIDHSDLGSIQLAWAKPDVLDTLPAAGPWEYDIFRSNDLIGSSMTLIATMTSDDLNETSWVDSMVNTEIFPWTYGIDMYYIENSTRYPVGQGEKASSLYPELVGMDNEIRIQMKKNVPWINYDYTIYRMNGVGGYDSVGFTTDDYYVDKGLVNGRDYCYRITSTGWRILDDKLYENMNFSHTACTAPEDSIAPCPPVLDGFSLCDSGYNHLSWSILADPCAEDVVGYKLYYTPVYNEPATLLAEFTDRYDTVYNHYPEHGMSGCYVVTAIDSFNNESEPSVRLCLDECSNYILSNVFSPNDDGINDLYVSQHTNVVEKVEMSIFNRQGILVFYTEDPDINWDGHDKTTKRLVSPGVYYYVCMVYEMRLTGIEPHALTGFIYVFSGDENNVFIEN